MLRRSWLSTAMVILVVTAGAAQADKEATRAKTPITGVDKSYMDPTVSPCKDFYAYANGAFAKVPIPGEYASYGVNQELDEATSPSSRKSSRIRLGPAAPRVALCSVLETSTPPASTRTRSTAKDCGR